MARRSVPALLALVLACGSGGGKGGGLGPDTPSAVRQAAEAGTPVDPALVSGGVALGADLLARVGDGGNVLVSPLSLSLALAMAGNGAAGGTRLGMAQAMRTGSLDAAALGARNAARLASLLTADPACTFIAAQGIWARGTVLPGFLDLNRTYYGAEVAPMDGAPATVNAWVSRHTAGTIPQLLPPSTDCSRMEAILVNTLYFKGAWASAFRKEATAPAPFTREDGTQVTCQLMRQTLTMAYGAAPAVQVGELPYGNGRFAMFFLLPAPGTSLAGLDGPALERLLASTAQVRVALALPRFRGTWRGELRPHLEAMGMAAAFDPARAEFPGLSARATYLEWVVHSTFVAVDEAGTTAGAGTGVGVTPTAYLPPAQLTLDRPFLYGIRDTRTGELLFLGWMRDPA